MALLSSVCTDLACLWCAGTESCRPGTCFDISNLIICPLMLHLAHLLIGTIARSSCSKEMRPRLPNAESKIPTGSASSWLGQERGLFKSANTGTRGRYGNGHRLEIGGIRGIMGAALMGLQRVHARGSQGNHRDSCPTAGELSGARKPN